MMLWVMLLVWRTGVTQQWKDGVISWEAAISFHCRLGCSPKQAVRELGFRGR
jgi:hypothetical protein